MKKLYYLIILTVILGLVLTGCLLSNLGQVPTTEQSGITHLTKGTLDSDDLVGLWHFDGDALDSSGNGLDGALSPSGASFVVDGFGQALNFDGTGRVQVPDSLLLEPSEITVEAWVKKDGSPGSCKYIVSKDLTDRGGYSSYGLYTGSGGIRFYIGYASNWIGSPKAPASAVWDGEWHHVAGTFDGLNIKLYLDGVQVDGATSTIEDIYYFGTGNLYIGDFTNSSKLAFSGTIDEVRIWNRALIAEEIWDNFLLVPVGIDIKPGSDPNSINPNSKGLIPVAILGSDTFDVEDVDVTTLKFGLAEATPAHDLTDSLVYADHLQDVNLDDILDLVCHFRTKETGIEAGDTSATLTGETFDGSPIEGEDTVRTVGR